MFFSTEVYKKRRETLVNNMPKDSALILPSWPETKRSWDVEWPYRPSSDLVYLTGFEESQACLIILSNSKNILFVQNKNPKKEIWTGPTYGPEQAAEIFQIDTCYFSSDFSHIAPEILKNTQSIYYAFNINQTWDTQLNQLIQTLKNKNRIFISLHDPTRLMAPLRMKKSKEEIQCIKKAVAISSEAHITIMKHCREDINERELYGLFLSEIMKKGANAEAYPGIFASGPNACILHYTDNTRLMKRGDLLLVDAGAEYKYYASDITRTFPINGKFTKIQKKLYTKLLKIQKQMIKFLKPGLSFNDIQNKLIKLLTVLMKEENILSGSIEEIIETKKYAKYFPHTFGHLLGLDVHDPTFSETHNIQLEEEFVLTMEPGLYLPPDDLSLKPEMRGLGFRIEDDILITKTGSEVLSHAVPKEVEELEALISTGLNKT